jgi:hypothetical protein
MKRYLLFTYQIYYPSGGWNDFKGSFDDIEEARGVWTNDPYRDDRCQVIDRDTGQIVWKD